MQNVPSTIETRPPCVETIQTAEFTRVIALAFKLSRAFSRAISDRIGFGGSRLWKPSNDLRGLPDVTGLASTEDNEDTVRSYCFFIFSIISGTASNKSATKPTSAT